MHVHFEQNTCTRTDSNFLSLSWMGKVPEDLPEEGSGWKLNRAQYYVEGWLASGNARGTVGVTFSTSHCHTYDAPPRSNFNLRGHRSEVVLVRWNEPYQKLATCDSRGVIFVWIKHEGRWSIELINDRNSQVTDFAWSHDGRMALICYRDGFILVGSVAGQRYWSSMLNLDNTSVTCGVWSPDDQQVMFGTVDGQIIVMSSAGALVTQVAIHEGFEITSMAWSCEKFNMEEAESDKDGVDHGGKDDTSKSYVLAVCFKYGDIYLMSGYDDICPVMLYTTLTGVKIDWSNCGEYLAVGGYVRLPNLQCRNELHLYSKDGSLIRWVSIPSQGKPLTAMTWGHNDKRLFLAAGCRLYVAWISKQVVPLQFLCQRVIHQSVRSVKAVDKLPLPQRLRCGVKALFSPTIKSYIPDPLRLREFVCGPPPGGERLFCTMIRHGEETSGGHYTLYLEYLGGLVPLLKGKRASKLRPDFIIYDPKIKSSGKAEQSHSNTIESDMSSESETDIFTDGCGSPRMQRRRKQKVFRADKVDRSITFRTLDELMFDDNLPETNRLVEVTSNIWGTKFQITGVASSLPACLGQVVYKTSLLHLQPRQMTITIVEISPARPVLPRDPNFTPAPHAADDEDVLWASEADLTGEKSTVEVTVHDAPAAQSVDLGCKVEGSVVVDGGRRSISMDSPVTEHKDAVNGDPNAQHCKLSSSGTVRSRSLSPVWNSLTQASSGVKQDGVCSGIRQDTNNSRGCQGARPKANSKKHPVNASSKNKSNIPKSSPRHSGTNSNKHAALSKSNHGNTYSTFHYANSSGVMTQTTTTNKVKSFSSSPPTTVSCKRKEVNVSNCLDKGVLESVSNEGLWKGDEASLFRDHPALSQHFTGSSSTSTGNVMIPLVDAVRGEGPRWADPASPSTKLLEEGAVQASSVPLENNLVADCSPTAPNCLDLHRRLYLAQQNIVDTGTPISPSNCPSCLPVQSTSGADVGASPLCVSSVAFSDHAAHTNLNSAVGFNFTEGTSFESRLSKDSRQHQSEVIHSSASSKHSDSEIPLTGLSVLPNGQVVTAQKDQSHTAVAACRNCLLQRSIATHNSRVQQVELLFKDSNMSGQDLSKLSTMLSSTRREDIMPQMSVLKDQCGEPQSQNMTSPNTGSWPFPRTLQKHEDQPHHPLLQSPSSYVHSRLPKDLSSFEKLSLILSEDPSAQNSIHNFRSMPGFVMKNPDLKDDDEGSTSSDRDISENSDEQQTAPALCSEDLLSNHIEIQHISASLPSSPIRFGAKQNPNAHNLHEEILKGRCKHLSPLLGRKSRDVLPPTSDFFGVEDSRMHGYETSEVFQKSQLKQKMRHRLNETCSRHEQARTFTMHNKAPLWNETSQVYQLDFGGRVTQESAKNFQIELRGKQVMQFGRIDNNAYTLDFQHPFTAVQAFAVALANVTQRLK